MWSPLANIYQPLFNVRNGGGKEKWKKKYLDEKGEEVNFFCNKRL
jgi:hypothetical protein